MMKARHTCLLGLDVGGSKVGLALSDRTLAFAQPLGRVDRRPDRPFSHFPRQVARRLVEVVKAHRVAGLVVGYPLELWTGQAGERCKEVFAFMAQVYRSVPHQQSGQQQQEEEEEKEEEYAMFPSSPQQPLVLCGRQLSAVDVAEFVPLLAAAMNEGQKEIVPQSLFIQMEERRAEAAVGAACKAFDEWDATTQAALPIVHAELNKALEIQKNQGVGLVKERLAGVSRAKIKAAVGRFEAHIVKPMALLVLANEKQICLTLDGAKEAAFKELKGLAAAGEKRREPAAERTLKAAFKEAKANVLLDFDEATAAVERAPSVVQGRKAVVEKADEAWKLIHGRNQQLEEQARLKKGTRSGCGTFMTVVLWLVGLLVVFSFLGAARSFGGSVSMLVLTYLGWVSWYVAGLISSCVDWAWCKFRSSKQPPEPPKRNIIDIAVQYVPLASVAWKAYTGTSNSKETLPAAISMGQKFFEALSGGGGGESGKGPLGMQPAGTRNANGSTSLGNGYTVDRNGRVHDEKGRFK